MLEENEDEHRADRPNWERIQLHEVTALELWDVKVRDGIIGDFTRSGQLVELLPELLLSLFSGEAEHTSVFDTSLEPAKGFQAVYLTGGNVDPQACREALLKLPFCALFPAQSRFSAARAGVELLKGKGLSGLAVDVGQSAIKICSESAALLVERDFSFLPEMYRTEFGDEERYRQRLKEFLGDALARAARELLQASPQAVLFALPCQFDSLFVPSGVSSYPGLIGNDLLCGNALIHAGLSPEKVLLINDAELAASAAMLDRQVSPFSKILVITLGFGIGGAVLRREELPHEL